VKLVGVTGEVHYQQEFLPPVELPITTTKVFVQSGEITSDSVTVMARCNDEKRVSVKISYQAGSLKVEETGLVDATTDYTVSFKLTGLASNTKYSYSVLCGASQSRPGASFKTAPAKDNTSAVSFVWAADLAGQGWGRNPEMEIRTKQSRVVM
jgi:alkaline phosphatase D